MSNFFFLAATRNFGGHRPPNLHGEASRNTKMLISWREKEMRTSYTYWPDSYYTSRGDARIGLFIRAIGKDFIFFILVVAKAESGNPMVKICVNTRLFQGFVYVGIVLFSTTKNPPKALIRPGTRTRQDHGLVVCRSRTYLR